MVIAIFAEIVMVRMSPFPQIEAAFARREEELQLITTMQ